jgi:hypothetical protein
MLQDERTVLAICGQGNRDAKMAKEIDEQLLIYWMLKWQRWKK